jgi:ribosomal protein S27AE
MPEDNDELQQCGLVPRAALADGRGMIEFDLIMRDQTITFTLGLAEARKLARDVSGMAVLLEGQVSTARRAAAGKARPGEDIYETEVDLARAATSITCPRCGMTSHNPHDITNRYCGNCHAFHGKPKGGK